MSSTLRTIDWRTPIRAVAEETYWLEVSEDGSREPRRAIRWHVSAEGLERIRSMRACWDCLNGFPAPPRPDTWAIWKTSGFNWLFSVEDSRRLICDRRCPFCKSEITPEMLAVQLDEEWTAEDALLKKGSMLHLEDMRERDTHRDEQQIARLGLRDPVAPPSKRKSAKRRGES